MEDIAVEDLGIKWPLILNCYDGLLYRANGLLVRVLGIFIAIAQIIIPWAWTNKSL